MKKPEEIKKGLECCSVDDMHCGPGCPYKDDCLEESRYKGLESDALALIQQLEKRVIHLEALNQQNLSVITMQERTRARLEERISQLEAQVPRWIPVEERLPERHGQQCVGLYSIGEYKGYLTPYIFTWHAYGNNGYVDGPHFNDEGLDGLKVHYWMPLPPLPKAPKEDAHG